MKILVFLCLALSWACTDEQGTAPPVDVGHTEGGADGAGGAGGAGGLGEGGAGGEATGYRLVSGTARLGAGRTVDDRNTLHAGVSSGAVSSTNNRGRLIAIIAD